MPPVASPDTAPTVVELGDGLFAARLPLPFRVEPVNCYIGLANGADDTVTVVDTGLAPGAEATWRAVFEQIGIEPTDVGRIVVTHFHPDHIGAAAPLAALTGAPVWASAVTAAQTPHVWGPTMPQMFADLDAHLLAHGMPHDRVAQLADEPALARRNVHPTDTFELLAGGDELQFAGAAWRVVPTPGHADGHISLFDALSGRLLAGDHLLERITPAVGLYPDASDDPLAAYLRSLDRVAALEPTLVLPGHGVPFAHAAERARQLVDHHERRLAECLSALDAGAGSTAHDVATTVFGAQPDAANERFAVTETLAHLEFARHRGQAQRAEGADGRWRYRP